MEAGTIQQRESFLNNIAKQLGRERMSTVVRPDWKYNPQLELYKGVNQDDLVEILKNQCNNIHTTFRETTTVDLENVVNEVITEYEGKLIVAENDSRFEEFGLSNYLHTELPKEHRKLHLWDPGLGQENIEFSKTADVGIAFSDITLAESGTVVLFSSSMRGRSVSLLPISFICIIPKSTIVPRMTQAASAIHKQIEAGDEVPSCVNFITGPSNSADIEMVLIVGVHGPVKVTYIVVSDK
ncbi:LutC/YkgG family protein [Calidifontibacillus oryziterrae]|uniref:LutC/YkgG family protein n=1 Tax=Calidifontibacillus oryziterrae TaxID=1191699 RepID=UPI000300A996|nr:lactate utilization protein C [Calidifontibacillus oryziterrae]